MTEPTPDKPNEMCRNLRDQARATTALQLRTIADRIAAQTPPDRTQIDSTLLIRADRDRDA